ncbi:MAG: universal stress protein [Cyanobacteria bacterium J06650_10]
MSCEYIQPHGHPGLVICQAATENDADLIVVGNRDQTTLISITLGSVSNYVLHHAPCSVTVVHSANRREATA